MPLPCGVNSLCCPAPFQACPRTVSCNSHRAVVPAPPAQTPRGPSLLAPGMFLGNYVRVFLLI